MLLFDDAAMDFQAEREDVSILVFVDVGLYFQ